MSRQDRQGVRRPADLEIKYNFDERFDSAMEAAKEAGAAVENLDKVLNQDEVFNRLTNSGASKAFILDEHGQIYINAKYIASGVLQSKDGNTFYLDLVNCILRGKFSTLHVGGKTVDQIAQGKADIAEQRAKRYADNSAKNASSSAVKSLTQADVLNKLTNNGKAEGIYGDGGEIYFDADFIAKGTLQTKDKKTFSLDLENNVFKIAGKKVSWKENEDGTFTLVGE